MSELVLFELMDIISIRYDDRLAWFLVNKVFLLAKAFHFLHKSHIFSATQDITSFLFHEIKTIQIIPLNTSINLMIITDDNYDNTFLWSFIIAIEKYCSALRCIFCGLILCLFCHLFLSGVGVHCFLGFLWYGSTRARLAGFVVESCQIVREDCCLLRSDIDLFDGWKLSVFHLLCW